MDKRTKRGKQHPLYKTGQYATDKERARSKKRTKAGYFAAYMKTARACGAKY